MGNFPYYWSNPNNLQFNLKTYEWINANLRADTRPLEQAPGSTFTNLFGNVLQATEYTLSRADQEAFNIASRNAVTQQGVLLAQWQETYGSLPPTQPGQNPIDAIEFIICNDWATNPPVSLMEVQTAVNLSALFEKTPASGQQLLQYFANWANALGVGANIQNGISMNNGQKAAALNAVQFPTSANGALTIGTTAYPAYNVATPVSTILNGLSAVNNAVTIKMTVNRFSTSEYRVTVAGRTGFLIPVASFFTLGSGTNTRYFEEQIAIEDNSVEIEMTFSGVTLVQYAPVSYNSATGKDWFFMNPIRQAIANGNADVTGFKFTRNPNIDFTKNGSFGLMQGVAISNYPSIKITAKGSNYEEISTTIRQSSGVRLSFLGIPLGGGATSSYSHETTTERSEQSVTITMDPPQELIAGATLDSEGWILGVQADFPAS